MKAELNIYCDKGNLAVLISSSGKSLNILNDKKNPLKKINTNGINFWINSRVYNYIERMHLLLLMSITDCIIGKSIYKA